jgi:divalent metal cation (Fe/Co/Zn/Cd) transporter
MVGSISVLAGLIAVRAGFQQGDAFAALIVAAIIFGAATRLIFENAQVLMDKVPAEAESRARRAIEALDADVEVRRLRLRESGGRYFADVVVGVPPGRAVVEGHAAADEIEDAIERALPNSDVVVHVEPRRRGLDLRDRVLAVALADPLVREAHDITIFEHERGRVSVSLHLKLPDDLALAEAHEVAERVEAGIAAEPGVADVQTHLEPLERPLHSAGVERPSDRDVADAVSRFARNHTGRPARSVRVLPSEIGSVVFLTIPVDSNSSLADAHALASELEEGLRREVPELADVVVHTEP